MTWAVEVAGTLFAALVLAAIHVGADKIGSLHVVPRSSWLSISGGAAVAYVFVHLFPELEEGQAVVGEIGLLGGFLDRHIYLFALFGFVLFYGLEILARHGSDDRVRSDADGRIDGRADAGVRGIDHPLGERTLDAFRLHVGTFAAYNAMIGYLLVHRYGDGPAELALFALAMGLHLVVNDDGLRRHFSDRYHTAGRWILAAGVLCGWAVAQVVAVSDVTLHVLYAVLAGGVILNVIKEELPEERDSRIGPFLAGAVGFAIVLLAV